MKTIQIKIDEKQIEEQLLKQAGQLIKNGGLVAFPTETVYGLGADALNSEAAVKIYAAKGRPSDNPLIVHIADYEALFHIALEVSEKAKALADQYWPGPLTMIFQKKESVPFRTTGGLQTVAVRMPGHKIALELIRKSGGYIAAPSANISGRPSPTQAQHVAEDMNGKIDMIIDGGEVGIGIESTIIDMSGAIPVILRPGFIDRSMIEAVIGPVVLDPTILRQNTEQLRPKAPGMMYKHYAPKAELSIVEGSMESVVKTINDLCKEKCKKGYMVGIIATEETKQLYHAGIVKVIGSRNEEASIVRGLYRVLREFDHTGVEFIYSESFADGEMGLAIMSRMLKAAGHKVISL